MGTPFKALEDHGRSICPPSIAADQSAILASNVWRENSDMNRLSGESYLALLWQIFRRHGIPESLFL
jgi:hypothetical protein